MFRAGTIEGVIVREIAKHGDARGWLAELYREDEIDPDYRPVMAYISMTSAEVARGPHEHLEQADFFVFLGPSAFNVYLWDNRKESSTYRVKQVVRAGEDEPKSIIIPPGVVHAYRNVGGEPGMVVNCPNRLFAGRGRKGQVDEIRHENDPNSIFLLD